MILAIIGAVAFFFVALIAFGVWRYQSMAGASTAGEARVDASRGQSLYLRSCAPCHGINAQGLPHMGIDLRDSAFVAHQSDGALVNFIRAGRMPTDPQSKTHLMMPPRGGNAGLTDHDLADIVAHLRQVQQSARSDSPGGASASLDPSQH